jgi:glycosyltransferase involved in cell wall biosynthesis
VKISICIPTYNRADCLVNCLNSIILNNRKEDIDYQVCVSDNCSTDHTLKVVRDAEDRLNIKYFAFPENVGRVKNYLNVVEMADGDFIWLLGDDDLLLPNALSAIVDLIAENPDVDFFCVNSFNLSTEYVFSCPQPFDVNKLPGNLTTFSPYSVTGKRSFISLVDPEISFDFLGAMFLAVFRRDNWAKNIDVLDIDAISDKRTFSHFDNTFPHVKIFAKAFANSKAYFCSTPLTVNLSGAREWEPMSSLINIVRLVEALGEYRKNGLPLLQYLKCKNFALRTFWPDFLRMILFKKESGYEYIHSFYLLLNSLLYPYSYFSPFYYLFEKVRNRLW